MTKQKNKAKNPDYLSQKHHDDFSTLSHNILQLANTEIPRIDFLREVAKMIFEFSKSNWVELWMRESPTSSRCEITRFAADTFLFEIISPGNADDAYRQSDSREPILDKICKDIIYNNSDNFPENFSRYNILWINDTTIPLPFTWNIKGIPNSNIHLDPYYSSLVLIPLIVGEDMLGLLQLKQQKKGFFIEEKIESYKAVAQTLGIALLNQRAQAALRERVKELTCLYSLAQLAERSGASLDEILQGVTELLPPGWHYPEITLGKITLDGRTYSTKEISEQRHIQTADIVVKGRKRGVVEVIYTVDKPTIDEGPFLREERSLINAIAREVSLLIERREAEHDQIRLQDQLRHADRLATIGQLAAGVAHELNEPLGNILGFAQLTQKCEGLPEPAKQDIEKIVSASLYAREVIKKLMLFARQTPPCKTPVNLNKIVEEGLTFFEARCAKAGIKLMRQLSPDLPAITADLAQLNQMLINLVVNAIQAMPDGGELKIGTLLNNNKVSLIVEDTGIGMSEDITKQIFLPFFTTKDVDQGTGLGLAVVHGIVTSHQGSIQVDSQAGKGSKFEIQLPIAGSPDNMELKQNDFY